MQSGPAAGRRVVAKWPLRQGKSPSAAGLSPLGVAAARRPRLAGGVILLLEVARTAVLWTRGDPDRLKDSQASPDCLDREPEKGWVKAFRDQEQLLVKVRARERFL